KLHTNWNWVEGKKDNYYFNDIDWQLQTAEQNNVKIIYVIGMKTGRWPECHIPTWAENLPEKDQQAELMQYMTEVVQRYKSSKAIAYWQVENEPLFKFGECPAWYYQNDNFLKTEVALVKSLDPTRKIIVSDSGEQSTWFGAAEVGDIVGITMYRDVWAHITDTLGFNISSFLNPVTYMRKAQIIHEIFGKNVICIELQSEPWESKPLMQSPLQDQLKSMNPEAFKTNIEFAKETGLDKFYLWGVEWWYWLKTKQNEPQIWNEAKQLFNN
ncbi:MAG: endo-1,4-beta-xylanase, partial [Candidatus Staskawiczbacteria bacterium]